MNMNPAEDVMKVAVRCKQCKRIVAYKLSAASGRLQIKCPKCGCEMKIDLSLRRTNIPIYFRKTNYPIQTALR